MDKTLHRRVFGEFAIKNSFCMRQGLGTVDVLPMSVANIKSPKFSVLGELAHAVGERAVSVLPRRFEAGEESRAAQEHAGVECIVAGEILANSHDVIASPLHLGGVVQVKDTIYLRIDCENDFVIREVLSEQCFGGFRLEDVVR